MKAKRLLKVANMLNVIDPKKLDMESWTQQTECGTKFCVMGFTANLGLFKNFDLVNEGISDPVPTRRSELFYRKGNETFQGWTAIEKLFDIDEEQAEYLFTDGDSPEQLADRIREFVATNGECMNETDNEDTFSFSMSTNDQEI